MIACVHSSFKSQNYFVNYFLNMKLRRRTPEEEVIFFSLRLLTGACSRWPSVLTWLLLDLSSSPSALYTSVTFQGKGQFDLKMRKVPEQIVMILS